MLRSVYASGVCLLGRTHSLTAATGSLFNVSVRHHKPFRYPKVTYLPFEWDYPPKKNFILESGDLTSDFGFSEEFLDKPRRPFDKIPEFETVPDGVKKAFSNRFTSNNAKRRALLAEFVKHIQRHPHDVRSIEYKIAQRTFFLRAMREYYYTKALHNRRLKVAILEAVYTRNNLLTMLGKWDTEKYEYIKEYLGIEHTPPPIERLTERKTRKGVLRKMTAEYANKMKEEKMQAYHEKLKQLQKEFEIEKRQTEEWMAKEIAELKLSDEEVNSLEYKGRILQ